MKKFIISLVLLVSIVFFEVPAQAAGSDFIIINKSNNQLAYYSNNKLVKTFKVGTGRQPSYTPEGKFKIVNKIKNRPYYSGNIPGGDPRNPLGNRWLGINARGTWGTTYAIHGNNNPSTIGGYVSAGCVRMYDDEVEWLYNQVKVNTPVIITSSSKSFHSIAAANGYKVSGGDAVPVTTTPTSTVLKKGMKGAEVRKLQQDLTNKGYSTKGIDGIFGSNTEAAVKKFQKANNIKADGVVGESTKKALGMKTSVAKTPAKKETVGKAVPVDTTVSSTPLKKGMRSAEVKKLQQVLSNKGYSTKGIDGIFGSNTEAAVKKFQKANNIKADGVVGESTKKALGMKTSAPKTTAKKSTATSKVTKQTAAKPVPVETTFSSTLLKKGMKGAEVKKLQQVLTNKGYSTKGIDGVFGSNTEAAVKKFQKSNKLKVDGVVGPATKKAL
ncbi:peptidoglycan-binding protein [Mesobacillus maritimus]|uniref:L,D-transpeptidase family protein n=1 Tax=Mesobacillus maritimus TaxID=1643336 RepID=UPI00384B38C1